VPDRVDAVFAALADPTRRRVLDELNRRGGATATELAADLPVTRQAVAKHLGILAGAELVRPQRTGRETRYVVTPTALGDAIAWMAGIGAEWEDRLARREQLTGRRAPRRKRPPRSPGPRPSSDAPRSAR
jgi:DNA-binding transcriptional ArsR family regulator